VRPASRRAQKARKRAECLRGLRCVKPGNANRSHPWLKQGITSMSVDSAIEAARRGAAPATSLRTAHRLDQAEAGRDYRVRQVAADPQVPERARQLEEIGFLPGEHVRVMTRGFPGGDPLVVRIGQSTFALRGAEAVCVRVA
jgi:ferrous iron transport protein A